MGSSVGANEEEKIYGGILSYKTKCLNSYLKFSPMTWYQLIENWLLDIIFENVPPLWTLSSKEVRHIKNGTRMWNTVKCFISEVNRVAIGRFYRKAKMKDWDYMSEINIWDNVQNYLNKKYMANKKQKRNLMIFFYNRMSYSNIFQNPKNAL